MRMSAIVLMMALAGLPDCSLKLETSDFVGTYEAIYSYGVETLILKVDGTYEQSFKYSDGKGLSNNGMWKFSTVAESDIRLSNALIVDNGFGKPVATANRGDWIMRARKNIFTGTVSLNFNDDLGVAFKKK